MSGFSRTFLNLRRLFPASQTAGVQPSEVSESVQLVHDLLKPNWSHDIKLYHEFLDGVAIAGDNVQALGNPAIPPGYWRCPVWTAINGTAATSRFVDIGIGSDLLSQDFWGTWQPGFGTGAFFDSVNTTAGGTGGLVNVAIHYPPIPRGHFYTIVWRNCLAGESLRFRQIALDIPGDLLNLELFVGRAPKSHVRTTAI